MRPLPEVTVATPDAALVYCAAHPGGPHITYALCRHLLDGACPAWHVEAEPGSTGALFCSLCIALRGSGNPALVDQADDAATLACIHCVAPLIRQARESLFAALDGLSPFEFGELAFAEREGYFAFGTRHGELGMPFHDPMLRWAWSLGFRRREEEVFQRFSTTNGPSGCGDTESTRTGSCGETVPSTEPAGAPEARSTGSSAACPPHIGVNGGKSSNPGGELAAARPLTETGGGS